MTFKMRGVHGTGNLPAISATTAADDLTMLEGSALKVPD